MSDFWRSHDPETGEPNCVKFLRLSLDAVRLKQVRLRELAEAQP